MRSPAELPRLGRSVVLLSGLRDLKKHKKWSPRCEDLLAAICPPLEENSSVWIERELE